jgi:hypothetical protein
VGDEHRGIVESNSDVTREVEVVDVLLSEDLLGALGEPRGHHEDWIIRIEVAELSSHAGEKLFRIPRGEGGLGLDEETDASVLLGWREGDEGIDDPWGARLARRDDCLAGGFSFPRFG